MTTLPQLTDHHIRQLLFKRCTTKSELHAWIMSFLHLDLPDTIVDPDSNSTPMDIIWEVYESALKNVRVDFARVLAYASRDSFKTLGAAVLEVLAVFHLQRNVAHMAAIESQAKKAQSYVKAFFGKPYLRDYVVGNNDRRKEISRFFDAKTGTNLTLKQFESLSLTDKLSYEEISNYITIVICTPRGANSEHVPFFVVDEVDLANPVAYEEAKMIPGPIHGLLPITLLTSTRKYSFGLVQKEIDDAAESGLHIRHWNIIDVTERCDPERHRPDLPRQTVYYNDDDLTTISPEQYADLTPDKKDKYKEDTAYSGCTSNCKLFAMCRGRLATKQKPTNPDSKVRSLLKPVSHTQNQFRTVSVDVAKAQLLCRKPSTEGLIYPNFDPLVHMMTAAQMAEKITGMSVPANFSKGQLIALLQQRECRFVSGMDFGYTHNFSVVTGAIDGNRCFVFDVISQAEIELEQQIDICNMKIKYMSPKIAADDANPQAIKTFSKRGYRIAKAGKDHGSVLGGIETVRMMLKSAGGDVRMFFLKDDVGVQHLTKRMGSYHWKLDAAGEPSDVPDDKDDDECDALRYLAMANFSRTGKVMAAKQQVNEIITPAQQIKKQQQTWMTNEIAARTGDGGVASDAGMKGKKGSFFFDL